MLASLASKAQVTYASITNGNPSNWTLDDGRFWQGGVPPPNPCTNCRIYINSSVTMVTNNGTSSTGQPAGAGGPGTLSDIVLNGGTILKVNGAVTLTINTYLELFDTQVIIGSDLSTVATVLLNDQADLNGTSSIQLGNINCSINANNNGVPPTFTSNPINGPHADFFSAATKSSGIFGIFTPADGNGYTYSYVLNPNGIGKSNNPYPTSDYLFNCGGASPHVWANGFVYGPATSSFQAT